MGLLHLSLFMVLKMLDKNNKFYIRGKQRHVEKTQLSALNKKRLKKIVVFSSF